MTITPTTSEINFSGARILISAGGTGGHIYPALATAKSLREVNATIHWLGTPNGPEGDIARDNGFAFHAIDVKGLRSTGLKRLVQAPMKIANAISASKRVIRDCEPSAFLGFGGFVTGPAGVAARLCRVPVVIHEQNAIPGLTNRLLHRISRETLAAFPNDVWTDAEIVGNPIRRDIAKVEKVAREFRPVRLTVIGGSLGAKPINDIMPEVATMLKNVFICHQTGKKNYDATLAKYKSVVADIDVDVDIVPYIDDMAKTYANTDLLIARAGALTVSEAASAGVPAIFIPLPHAVDNHQFFNAKFSADNQAAVIIEQADLTVARLSETIRDLLSDRKLTTMALNAKKMSHEDALMRVVERLHEIVMRQQQKKTR